MSRLRRSHKSLAAVAGLAALAGSSSNSVAGLEITTSVSTACRPLNISWVPEDDGYPYSVWVSGIRGSVQNYAVDASYQLHTKKVTFQYVVSPPTIGFQSYMVAVADSKGNGNSTRPLNIAMPSNMDNGNCDAYTATPAWLWAGDPQNSANQVQQCGKMRFYNIDQRGTAPFAITWLPVQGQPITVNVPRSAELNQSAFIYEAIVPFPAGTQFQVMLGDALGGASGGGSELYTTGFSTNISCLDPGFRLPNRNTSFAFPPSTNFQPFRDLAGAVNETSSTPNSKGGGGSNVGAIAGGAIGGAIALAVVIGCLVAFLLFKRRQKKQKEDARKEEVHFVDLDGDDDEGNGAHAYAAATARRDASGAVQQHYSVSPFTYQASGGNEHQTGHEMTGISRNSSFGGTSPGGLSGNSGAGGGYPNESGQYGDLLAAAGVVRAPSSNNGGSVGHRPTSSHSFGSNHGLLSNSSSPIALSHPTAPFAFADRHRTNSSGSQVGAYRLRTTNDDIPPSHDNPYAAAASGSRHEAGPLPTKAPLPGDEETRQTQSTRRVVMHSDGGPLPQPESDDEDQPEELPPSYGGWTSGPSVAPTGQPSSSSQHPTYQQQQQH